jgi:hypothetical protein
MYPQDLKKLSSIIFNEPLSSDTETKRRNLLFTACFSILLSVYGLKVTKTPWLDFEMPSGAPNILQGALSAALLYTFIVFAFHAFEDLRRWYTANDMVYLQTYLDLSLNVEKHLSHITSWLDKPLPEDLEKQAKIKKSHSQAIAYLSELELVITKTKCSYGKLAILQAFRLYLFDLGIPLFLGIFAMIKISAAFIPFISVVFK